MEALQTLSRNDHIHRETYRGISPAPRFTILHEITTVLLKDQSANGTYRLAALRHCQTVCSALRMCVDD